MHEYSACPSQNRDIALERPQQTSDEFLAHCDPTQYFQDVSNRSSLDLSLKNPQDVLSAPALPTQGEPSHARTRSSFLAAHGCSKEKLIQPLLGSYSRWKTSRRLQTAVLGFYFISLVCAALHCWFFEYLDERVHFEGVELSAKTTTISQGYVTTISLLLTTAFRAALLASIGVCYTQYLWATLRERVLKVDLIEDLFQIQTNAFHLISPSLYIRTPILAAVAVFCWLAPIAMVYPPGALVVELNALSVDAKFNVSVLHVKNPMEDTDYMSNIWCRDEESGSSGPAKFPEDAYRMKTCFSRWESVDSRYITRTSLMSGEIASLTQPVDGNSSYSLEFWGPTLECEVYNSTIERSFFQDDLLVGDQRMIWTPDAWMFASFGAACELRSSEDPLYRLDNTTLTYRFAEDQSKYRYYPCLDSLQVNMTSDVEAGYIKLPESGIHIQIPIKETVCHPKLARYSVNVSHSAGRQNVSHHIEDESSFPAYASEFANFTGTYEQWVQLSDALQIYHDFADNINRSDSMDWQFSFMYPNASDKPESYTTSNGTIVDTCTLPVMSSAGIPRGKSEIWPLSVFQLRNPVTDFWEDCPQYDVEMAKELLLNSTISALSLNRRFDMVEGTTSRTFNVYRFQNKLAFFLPYGLSLGLSIPIIALGLVAFYGRNQGVSAITGGFLQILMTTTGRGSFEHIIAKGSGTMGGHENVSKELRDTMIRFGELTDADSSESGRPSGTHTHLGTHEDRSGVSILAQGEDDGQYDEVKLAPGVYLSEGTELRPIKVGFGVANEVRPLRRRKA